MRIKFNSCWYLRFRPLLLEGARVRKPSRGTTSLFLRNKDFRMQGRGVCTPALSKSIAATFAIEEMRLVVVEIRAEQKDAA